MSYQYPTYTLTYIQPIPYLYPTYILTYILENHRRQREAPGENILNDFYIRLNKIKSDLSD